MSVTSSLACTARGEMDPTKHTTSPIVTGTSVIAVKFKGGVLMATDTLGSYGSLARFTDVRRIVSAGECTLVGADGDYSDFQYIEKILKELQLEDHCVADGIKHTCHEVWSCLTRILYHRRTKMNPLWNNVVVGGIADGTPFLGTTDKIGTSYESDFVATGFGLHLAIPILRRFWREDMTEAEARELVEKCMKVLFYRDCRTINRITFATVTAAGTKINDPVALETKWDYQSFVNPKAGADTGGSW
mmetsp:Transcript_19949/g.32876  ORF Transcript_19949/g.32876 Transcript_19949/m.32876 type:complete len:246 (-) Transcript_19949:65-802(-)|eukprot:CAMPEP_0203749580 /NCGR_PEP_ID=MMETSP0098-20131031/4084_1 /ASSEMBLY_ACC=CAM_ASM_000208 /TAXON_ID=96639 /ORGANISM=" , Strain NY0313808BC1" /LENGTH=245 /DNA_ID=CAMNT_0050638657 /DNA_START=146 /DNA_END=883 /DNA_ORIENTATION=+